MLKKILLLLLVIGFSLVFSQDHSYDLLKEKTATGILCNRVFSIADATKAKTHEVTPSYYTQIYSEIQRADFLQRLPNADYLKTEADLGFTQQQIPLSLLVTDFESIKKSAFENGEITRDNKNQFLLKPNAENAFDVHHLTLMSALLSKTKTNSPMFVLKSNLVFNTTKKTITSIEINNKGKWQKIDLDVPFRLQFENNGTQILSYKITFDNNESLLLSFSIEVKNQNNNVSTHGKLSLMPNVVNAITASIPYKGYDEAAAYLGQGEYEVFLDTTNGVLDKPIILLDGFDPGDSRDVPAIYNLLNYGTPTQNLGDYIRSLGYDVIVLNFPVYTRQGTSTVVDGGVDFIQRNAMILVELLNQINSQKVGNEKNVIIGPSMGGLISRYALRYMEQNSMNHDARLYISFDSPHLGANVPIGFQHLFNYMGYGPIGDTTMKALVDGMLKSPAAREMLLDHFEGHLSSGSAYEFDASKLLPAGSPNFRNVFQTELNTMGFPQNTRNIAVINGAGNGTVNGTPGMEVLNHTFNTSSTQRAIININYTPAANQTKEVSHFKGQQWILFWITIYESSAKSQSPTYTDGLDTAPGGKFDLNAFASGAGGSPMLQEFLDNLKTDHFSFIPALSAMSITSTNNYYTTLTGGLNTPFAAFYMPNVNENHVTLQNQNVQFILNEILAGSLASQENKLSQLTVENPIKNTLRIKSSSRIENAKITIFDVSGRIVFSEKEREIYGDLLLPIQLEKGNYIVEIQSDTKKLTQKLIKE